MSIAKIYGSHQQFLELQGWLEHNKPEYLPRLNPEGNHDNGASIALFAEDQDMWLLENCPLEWLIERIKYQYDIGN